MPEALRVGSLMPFWGNTCLRDNGRPHCSGCLNESVLNFISNGTAFLSYLVQLTFFSSLSPLLASLLILRWTRTFFVFQLVRATAPPPSFARHLFFRKNLDLVCLPIEEVVHTKGLVFFHTIKRSTPFSTQIFRASASRARASRRSDSGALMWAL